MNKQEIENTQEAIKLLTDIRNSVTTDRFMDFLDTQLLDLQAQLAESEKPKLRHGDYGFDEDGEALLIHKQSSQEHPITSRDKKGCPCGRIMEDGTHSTRRIARLGNIFDDLAALKPIEEFEMECDLTGFNHIEITKCDNGLFLRTKGGTVHLHGKKLHDFILKLRCMELRKIQDAAKQ